MAALENQSHQQAMGSDGIYEGKVKKSPVCSALANKRQEMKTTAVSRCPDDNDLRRHKREGEAGKTIKSNPNRSSSM